MTIETDLSVVRTMNFEPIVFDVAGIKKLSQWQFSSLARRLFTGPSFEVKPAKQLAAG